MTFVFDRLGIIRGVIADSEPAAHARAALLVAHAIGTARDSGAPPTSVSH